MEQPMTNKSPAKTGNKQDARFKPGQSGNPDGRKAGSRNKVTLSMEALFEGEAEALTRTAIDKALSGDMVALRLCLERLCPPRKDRPITFSLPGMSSAKDAANAMAGILEAVADGDITPDEAGSVASIIEQYRRTLETTELEGRLQALEQATAKGN